MTNVTGINYDGYKNRLINGSMVINQRGFSGTVSGDPVYTLDRWYLTESQNSKFTISQNAGSVTPPVGFVNYLGATVASAVTIGASDYFALAQAIEGFNVADLNFGSANAKSVTISFWVYSSLTGTFGASLSNGAENRGYPFTYTISSANTWTQITQTIAGDTTGTWATGNTAGMKLFFGLGCGSTYSKTSGSWQAGTAYSATGATSVVGTNGATFYITGVQLEKGSTATSFDYRPIGTELLLCQRYYETTSYPDASQSLATTRTGLALGGGGSSNGYSFLVAKRTNAPTVTLYSRSNTSGSVSLNATGGNITGTAANICGTGFSLINLGTVQVVGAGIESGWTVSAEL
jgi:hypothetical protein